MQLLVTFILETSKKPEYDPSYSFRVNTRNDAHALVIAKKLFKSKYPNLNLAKVWYLDVEGKPNRLHSFSPLGDPIYFA